MYNVSEALLLSHIRIIASGLARQSDHQASSQVYKLINTMISTLCTLLGYEFQGSRKSQILEGCQLIHVDNAKEELRFNYPDI